MRKTSLALALTAGLALTLTASEIKASKEDIVANYTYSVDSYQASPTTDKLLADLDQAQAARPVAEKASPAKADQVKDTKPARQVEEKSSQADEASQTDQEPSQVQVISQESGLVEAKEEPKADDQASKPVQEAQVSLSGQVQALDKAEEPKEEVQEGQEPTEDQAQVEETDQVQEEPVPAAEPTDQDQVQAEPGAEVEEPVQEEPVQVQPTDQELLVEDQGQADQGVMLSAVTIEPLNVRSSNSTSSGVIGVLSEGTEVEGIKEDGWIVIEFNGETGYISESFVEERPEASVELEEVVEEAEAEEPIVEEAVAEVEEPAELVVEEAPAAQEPVEEVQDQAPATGSVASMVEEARATLGCPYVFGGSSYAGFDCSGLTSYLFQKHMGVWIGRTTYEQVNAGSPVDRANMQAGDLLCFSNSGGTCDHVGIYVGGDSYIHAATETRGVVEDFISGSYFQNNLIAIRRID